MNEVFETEKSVDSNKYARVLALEEQIKKDVRAPNYEKVTQDKKLVSL
jgi:hypothetical protein